jgi:hypothetical protein
MFAEPLRPLSLVESKNEGKGEGLCFVAQAIMCKLIVAQNAAVGSTSMSDSTLGASWPTVARPNSVM